MNLREFWQARLIELIGDKKQTRETLSVAYAVLMHLWRVEGVKADWGTVNRAILARYSASGLTYIKTKAWGMAGKPIPQWILDELETARLNTLGGRAQP